MPANRETVLAALRGARCVFHSLHAATLVDRTTCAACDLARADAVLAAIQPAGEADRCGVPSPAVAGLTCRRATGHPPDFHGDAFLGRWPVQSERRLLDAEGDRVRHVGGSHDEVENEHGEEGTHGASVARTAAPAQLPCGHPAACATTPDNPPHSGSTWACAWCAEFAAAVDAEREACARVLDADQQYHEEKERQLEAAHADALTNKTTNVMHDRAHRSYMLACDIRARAKGTR